MMMFPIALSVIHVMKESHTGEEAHLSNFSLTMMLAIAYAANIGGIATIIGTPPNVAFVGYIEKTFPNIQVDFASWMMICTPLAVLLLISLYVVMVKWLFPNYIKSSDATKQLIKEEVTRLGPISVAEKRVLIIFIGTAFLWITRKFINDSQDWIKLDDNIIAMICAVTLFICPSGKNNLFKKEDHGSILEWRDTSRMAWGILLLFGGGLSLAGALERAGLIQELGSWLAQFSGNGFMLVLIVVVVSIFISEMMSNVAQVIVFAPVVTSLALALNINPLILGIPMTLAASCASMLPMGTPPNAIVFASGQIRFKQMIKAGFVMNVIAIILITVVCWFLLPVFLKI
jgi:sodium-dependent dicarboxylate transporter 2/3/5